MMMIVVMASTSIDLEEYYRHRRRPKLLLLFPTRWLTAEGQTRCFYRWREREELSLTGQRGREGCLWMIASKK